MSVPTSPVALTKQEIGGLGNPTVTPSGTEAQRFVQSCSAWYREWLEANAPILDSNGIKNTQVLVLIHTVSPDIECADFASVGTDKEIVFRSAFDANLEGVVLTTENTRRMIRVRGGFSSISDAMATCMMLPPEATFVVLPLAQRKMMLHYGGDDLESWCEHPPEFQMRSGLDALSVERIDKDIHEFHDQTLKIAASRISRRIWLGPAKPYKLVHNPEEAIQSYLFTALDNRYLYLKAIVDEETVGRGGRCDIRVQWPNPGGLHNYTSVMIELKVLIEGRGNAAHRRWIWKGIKQANRYRRVDTAGVFACIFDGRKDQSDQMPGFKPHAERLNVNLRWYQMDPPLDKAWDDEVPDLTVAAESNIDSAASASADPQGTQEADLSLVNSPEPSAP
ncbi:TPA: hypothetical protein UMV35_000273 [Stenotrophomonas maltophilia]|uniref:hypothetical protein n=1 Tax=Stenotrophomonas TaxID=40323 RepID=UPI00114CED66|nr:MULTISPECIES: hypothetical protein [Stenotrophomonas]MBH1590860.1 hypothetical protein [Stenotrophomonas maltophilia]MDH2021719.1 hypothetical protein [Stenotrophomonas sp. GD03680]HDS1321624.1 hypothetical protein [Stenotrophomonas maltophilia]HDS1326233.1 hypothetical protein [Stenotrophomonas maltophilia]HDS1330939.1 hypothetical protein [Stenotrophomonas maltophilia]